MKQQNFRYLTSILLGGVIVASSCNAQSPDKGFKNLGGGLEAKTIVHGTGTHTAEVGDVAELTVILKMNDSVFLNTNELNGGMPVSQPIMQPSYEGDLMNGLMKMKAGDSTLFRMVVDTLAAHSQQPLPPGVPSGSYAVWEVKMVSLKSAEEAQKETAAHIEKQKKVDEEAILNYFKTNNITNYQKGENDLYYVINQEGSGASPSKGQTVTVNYTGKLLSDGTIFDSNTDPAFNHVQPFSFPLGVGQVIQGWDLGVAPMKKGEKRTLYIPSSLGYGPQGAGGKIPGNAVLIFDVELVNFN